MLLPLSILGGGTAIVVEVGFTEGVAPRAVAVSDGPRAAPGGAVASFLVAVGAGTAPNRDVDAIPG